MTNAQLLILLGIAVMLLLALGVVFFVVLYQRRVMQHHQELKDLQHQRRHDLLQASIRAGESERQRIAEELHDDVGATLSSIRLFLHSNRGGDTRESSAMPQAKDLLDEAIAKVRSLSHQLQPALLQRLGLQAALQSFADGLAGNGLLTLQYMPQHSLPKLPPETELAIYRVVQELAANIIRHSRAGLLRLETGSDSAGGWRITLLHDGQGLTQEEFQKRLYQPGTIGLKNIVNRMELIGATLVFSQDDDGLFRTEFSGRAHD